MSAIERLAGAVLCAGFEGARADDVLLDRLAALAPGGIVLFGRNAGRAAEVATLVEAIVARVRSPLLVAVDQEGGRVARLRDGVPELPSAMAFAAAGDPGATERAVRGMAVALRSAGINVDFAPCADLAIEPANTVIGARAYGDDATRAGEHVAAFVRGLHSGGVLACVKHAPGHGATTGDSHVELPLLRADRARLEARELVPFAAGIDAGARLVMIGHIVAAAIDPDRPATLSPAVIAYVRERLAYDGAIVSDCLTMAAVAQRGIGAAAVAALAAGIDWLIVSRLDEAFEARDAVVQAVRTGALPEARLTEAAGRIEAVRRSLLPVVSPSTDDADVGRATARDAVTAVRGEPRLRDDRPVTVVSFEGPLGDGIANEAASPSLSFALRMRRWKSEHLRVSLEPDGDEMSLLLALLASQPNRNVVIVARRAHRYPAQLRAIGSIVERVPDAIVVSAREPFDVGLFDARTVIAIYGDEAISFEGLADVLSGRAPARGTVPVRVPSAIDGATAHAQ